MLHVHVCAVSTIQWYCTCHMYMYIQNCCYLCNALDSYVSKGLRFILKGFRDDRSQGLEGEGGGCDGTLGGPTR